MQAQRFVPAHAEVTTDMKGLVELNRNKVFEIAEKLLDICKEPIEGERILQRIFNEYHLTMNIDQYVLIGSTIRSYLSWLKDSGKITFFFNGNQLLWERII